jgi:hypothetical protein
MLFPLDHDSTNRRGPSFPESENESAPISTAKLRLIYWETKAAFAPVASTSVQVYSAEKSTLGQPILPVIL